MKLGDMVLCRRTGSPVAAGTIIAFNKKGEGGMDYVHVFIEGETEIFMRYDVEVVSGRQLSDKELESVRGGMSPPVFKRWKEGQLK